MAYRCTNFSLYLESCWDSLNAAVLKEYPEYAVITSDISVANALPNEM